LSQTSPGGYQPYEVSAILCRNSRMARRRQQDACGFSAGLRQVGVSRPSFTAKKSIEVKRHNVLPCH
jgi:hypothetical protein